jgi:two-component system response regulator AtoC
MGSTRRPELQRSSEHPRILLHSQEPTLRKLLAAALKPDYRVLAEPEADTLKTHLNQGLTDLVILDLDSQPGSQETIFPLLAEIKPFSVPILVMADDSTRSLALQLLEHGVYDYFLKPPNLTEVKIILSRAHDHSQLKQRLKAIAASPDDVGDGPTDCDRLLGTSPAMLAVYDLIRRVANLNINVLVTGESGVGKELVARAIHNLSHRASRPFVALFCGAIPETLIEAELFGYEKGAFTGATSSQQGFIEQAGDGTLFLDEIGELNLNTQVKFLRVLQERTVVSG